MLCLVRGEIVSIEEGSLGENSYRSLIHARIRDRDLTVLQVDITGFPRVSRRPPLHALTELVGQHRSECLIVLGDFNTPKDSRFIAPLRAEMTNAFEAAGSGYAATWPLPLPVLTLDQIWTTDRLRAVRCEHMISWRSDHRAVVAEFDFTP
jgi:endonuclease/exonuclease/phosphatase (EEP) superfamily protein YafD